MTNITSEEFMILEGRALAAFRGWQETQDEQIAALIEICKQLQRQIDLLTGAGTGG